MGLQLNKLTLEINGILDPSAFMGISYENRAGFKIINVNVNVDFAKATQEQVNQWIKETEKRCPVSDNIQNNTKININIKQ
ncbi:MAG TPA: OsmC family protein [Bacteroidales bacterium]|nr:OsmC family protein [Bacteroidales bacterium]